MRFRSPSPACMRDRDCVVIPRHTKSAGVLDQSWSDDRPSHGSNAPDHSRKRIGVCGRSSQPPTRFVLSVFRKECPSAGTGGIPADESSAGPAEACWLNPRETDPPAILTSCIWRARRVERRCVRERGLHLFAGLSWCARWGRLAVSEAAVAPAGTIAGDRHIARAENWLFSTIRRDRLTLQTLIRGCRECSSGKVVLEGI
jgi:hypothetical protein